MKFMTKTTPRSQDTVFVLLIFFVLCAACSPVLGVQATPKPIVRGRPVIWSDPGVVEKKDLQGGIGGRRNAPAPPFTFLEESVSGSNPKIKVIDARGVQWTAKFGSEVNAETFSTRLAWACGYFVEPAYFVASGKIGKLGALSRARKAVNADGTFTDARFERKTEKSVRKLEEEQSWSWINNPFLGRKELNGLKVVLMLTSNWDNKDLRDVKRGSNTAIFQTPTSAGIEDRYLVTDWGGSMGKWGNFFSREKWDCSGYNSQTKDFVKRSQGGLVEFGYSGQHSDTFKTDIKTSDVQWLMKYLGRITDAQLRQGLQASGASPDEVSCFTSAIRNRIEQLRQVR